MLSKQDKSYLDKLQNEAESQREFWEMLAIAPEDFHFHVPYISPLSKRLREARARFMIRLNRVPNYFDTRHNLNPYSRRCFDLAFMEHFIADHYFSGGASWTEKWQYFKFHQWVYRKEQRQCYRPIANKKHKTKRERTFLEAYHQQTMYLYFYLRDCGDLEMFHDKVISDLED